MTSFQISNIEQNLTFYQKDLIRKLSWAFLGINDTNFVNIKNILSRINKTHGSSKASWDYLSTRKFLCWDSDNVEAYQRSIKDNNSDIWDKVTNKFDYLATPIGKIWHMHKDLRYPNEILPNATYKYSYESMENILGVYNGKKSSISTIISGKNYRETINEIVSIRNYIKRIVDNHLNNMIIELKESNVDVDWRLHYTYDKVSADCVFSINPAIDVSGIFGSNDFDDEEVQDNDFFCNEINRLLKINETSS